MSATGETLAATENSLMQRISSNGLTLWRIAEAVCSYSRTGTDLA
jgi:hypothetical protein